MAGSRLQTLTGCGPKRRGGAVGVCCTWLTLATVTAAALAADSPKHDPLAPYGADGPFPVGVRKLVLVDESRQDPFAEGPRTLVTEVWYPAVDQARGDKPTTFLGFFGGRREPARRFVEHFKGDLDTVNQRFVCRGVRDAELRRGKYPLLVFSHGNGGLRHQNTSQLDHLASHGFIVVSPDHTGNAGVTVLPDKVLPYDRRGRGRSARNRPRDVSFLLDYFLGQNDAAGTWLHQQIQAKQIGVLGHSFGGLTSCQVATSDPRVKAILPMTVAMGQPTHVPTFVMIGALDRTIKGPGNLASTAYFLGGKGPRHWLRLKRGGHFTFSDMDRIRPDFGDGIGSETRNGKRIDFLSTPLAKRIINAYTLAFFRGYLQDNAQALRFMKQNAYPKETDLRYLAPGTTRLQDQPGNHDSAR